MRFSLDNSKYLRVYKGKRLLELLLCAVYKLSAVVFSDRLLSTSVFKISSWSCQISESSQHHTPSLVQPHWHAKRQTIGIPSMNGSFFYVKFQIMLLLKISFTTNLFYCCFQFSHYYYYFCLFKPSNFFSNFSATWAER